MALRHILPAAAIFLLIPAAAVGHMMNMYDADRVVELRLAEDRVELRSQFSYREFPGLNLRLAMDRDADDLVTDSEATEFVRTFADSLPWRISLSRGNGRLELELLREPSVELYDSRRIIPQHCDIALEWTAELPLTASESRELALELWNGADWPYQGGLVLAVVAGRDVEVKDVSLPEGPPSGPDALRRVTLSVRERTAAELMDAGEQEWRIVRYAQAYYFPPAMASTEGNAPAADAGGDAEGEGEDHAAGLRSAVRKYLESGSGGMAGLWLILALAFGYGAVHAMAPGHAKTLTAAYLVGSRHRWPHALALAGIVTATHTGSILILAIVTQVAWGDGVSGRTQAILGAVSGLIVLVLGVQRLKNGGAHSHSHGDGHVHDHDQDHGHEHGENAIHHHHPSPPTDDAGYKDILWLGFAGGMAPCPGAIWVYFLALGFGRPGLGVMLIVAMSVGLALVLMAVGLGTIYLRGLLDRRTVREGGSTLPDWIDGLMGRVRAALPTVAGTALVIIGSYLVWDGLARMGVM